MNACDVIVHVASDMTFGSNPHEVVTSVVAGTETILRSAASPESEYAAQNRQARLEPASRRRRLAATSIHFRPSLYHLRCIKKEGERALWRFIEEQRPHFVVNAILPNLNLCSVLSSLGVADAVVPQVLQGDILFNVGPQYIIDIVNNARLQIIAVDSDVSLSNDRIFAFNIVFNWTDVVNAIGELRPRATSVATPPDDQPRDLSELPNERAELMKRWYGQKTGYKPFIQTIEEDLERHE